MEKDRLRIKRNREGKKIIVIPKRFKNIKVGDQVWINYDFRDDDKPTTTDMLIFEVIKDERDRKIVVIPEKFGHLSEGKGVFVGYASITKKGLDRGNRLRAKCEYVRIEGVWKPVPKEIFKRSKMITKKKFSSREIVDVYNNF